MAIMCISLRLSSVYRDRFYFYIYIFFFLNIPANNHLPDKSTSSITTTTIKWLYEIIGILYIASLHRKCVLLKVNTVKGRKRVRDKLNICFNNPNKVYSLYSSLCELRVYNKRSFFDIFRLEKMFPFILHLQLMLAFLYFYFYLSHLTPK